MGLTLSAIKIGEICFVEAGGGWFQNAWRNARRRSLTASGDLGSRNPTNGVAGCCARAASGHAVAAPPPSKRNSRRRIPDTRASPPSQSVRRILSLPPTPWQVLGADLNRSESRLAPYSFSWTASGSLRFSPALTRKSSRRPPEPAATRDWCCARSAANIRANDPRH